MMVEQIKSNTEISVVMPVYNSVHYLEESINSILYQTFKNFELIIVNDGSADGSNNIIKKFGVSDSRIKIIDQENMGAVNARNVGLAHANARYIAVMDSDDIAQPNRLEDTYVHLEENSNCICVGGGIISIGADGTKLGRGDWQPPLVCRSDFSSVPPNVAHLPHSTVLFRKSALKSLSGYRPFFKLAHDLDLLLRLEELGEVHCLPSRLIYYRRHNKGISTKDSELVERFAVMAMLSAIIRRAGILDPVGRVPDREINFRLFDRICDGTVNVEDYIDIMKLKIFQRNIRNGCSINMYQWINLWSKYHFNKNYKKSSTAKDVLYELSKLRLHIPTFSFRAKKKLL